jgi:nitroreductase
MEFFQVIKKRHCTRSFNSKKPVSDANLAKIIDAGKKAPSAGGLYPVKFAVVKDQKVKEKLAPTMTFLSQAPVVIVVYADQEKTAARYGQRGRDLYVIQDAAAAAENIFLAAIALGLAACWVGAFNEDAVRSVLNLKESERPMVIMPIGYPV